VPQKEHRHREAVLPVRDAGVCELGDLLKKEALLERERPLGACAEGSDVIVFNAYHPS
jgi:hypothetical protein